MNIENTNNVEWRTLSSCCKAEVNYSIDFTIRDIISTCSKCLKRTTGYIAQPYLKDSMIIKYKKLTATAQAPTQAYQDDIGWDLYSDEDIELAPLTPTKVKTGIALDMPKGVYIGYWDKSGMGAKGITIQGGLIDTGYRGELIVVLNWLVSPGENVMKNGFPAFKISRLKIKAGTKIGQFVVYNKVNTQLLETEELSNTQRGDKGFGSSN